MLSPGHRETIPSNGEALCKRPGHGRGQVNQQHSGQSGHRVQFASPKEFCHTLPGSELGVKLDIPG